MTPSEAASVVTPLYGHTSAETAYLVADYPYSFRLRCRIRYWIEYKAGKGFRFCQQTENPKTSPPKWNAPKQSTYTETAACLYLDKEGHVHWTGLGQYSEEPKILEFICTFPGADFTVLRLQAKAAINPKGLLAKLVSGEVVHTVTINGVRRDQPPEALAAERERYRERLAVWMRIAEKLGVG